MEQNESHLLGKYLEQRRKVELCLSQAQFAERLGRTRSFVRDKEAGICLCFDLLNQICITMYNESISDFFRKFEIWKAERAQCLLGSHFL